MFHINSWNSEIEINNTLLEIFEKDKSHKSIFTNEASRCKKKRKFSDDFVDGTNNLKKNKKSKHELIKKNKLKFKGVISKDGNNIKVNVFNSINKSHIELSKKTDPCDKKTYSPIEKCKSSSHSQDEIINKKKFINDANQSAKLKNNFTVNKKKISNNFIKSSDDSDTTYKQHKNISTTVNKLYMNIPNLKLDQFFENSNKNHNKKINTINNLNFNMNKLKSVDDLDKSGRTIKYNANINEKKVNKIISNSCKYMDNSGINLDNVASIRQLKSIAILDNNLKKPEDLINHKKLDSNIKLNNPSCTNLRDKMLARLTAGRFRYLNEQIADRNSYEIHDFLANDNECFSSYHEGFNQQVSKWKTNPVDLIIKYINNRSNKLVIADMGCGDAKIAAAVKNKVHSFDVAALNNMVVVSDMANVPLKSNMIDICVYCLSLMGKNLDEILCEGNRVLKLKGTLIIVEVKSRFSSHEEFVKKLKKIGFKLQNMDQSNKMFIWFEFLKFETVNLKKISYLFEELKPSVYRKR